MVGFRRKPNADALNRRAALALAILGAVPFVAPSHRASASIGDVFERGVGYCASTYAGHQTLNGFGAPVDINVGGPGADDGHALFAPADGTVSVTSSSPSDGFGLSITWTSSDGREKLHLAHLRSDSPLVARTVRAGELIGYVGQTGHAQGAHLHIARRLDARPAPLELSAKAIDPPPGTAENCPSGLHHYVATGPSDIGAEVSVLRGIAGDLRVVFRDSEGDLAQMWQPGPDAEWIGAPLPPAVTALPAVAETLSDLFAFFRDTDGNLRQVRAGADDAYVALATSVAGVPAVIATAQGGLAVFFQGSDDRLWHLSQAGPGADWLGPVALSAQTTSSPSALRTSTGELGVFFRGTDGNLWHVRQPAPDAPWTDPVRLEAAASSAPAVAQTATGGLAVFFRGTDGNGWLVRQPAPDAPWTDPVSLGVAITGAPAVVQTSIGGLAVFFRSPDGGLSYISENQPGTEWAAPVALPSATCCVIGSR